MGKQSKSVDELNSAELRALADKKEFEEINKYSEQEAKTTCNLYTDDDENEYDPVTAAEMNSIIKDFKRRFRLFKAGTLLHASYCKYSKVIRYQSNCGRLVLYKNDPYIKLLPSKD